VSATSSNVSGTSNTSALSVVNGTTLGGVTTINAALDVNSTADISDKLTLSKSSGVGLQVDAGATIAGDLTVTGDLNVNGSVTAVDTENLTVKDPIAEFGSNVTNTTDTGIIFARSSGEGVGNVAMFYDVSDTEFKLGYTNDTATNTSAVSTTGSLPVKVQGTLTTSGDVTVSTNVSVTDRVTTTNVHVTRIVFT
jgi:cytoskeletal protein CcmA (bactofilin family)